MEQNPYESPRDAVNVVPLPAQPAARPKHPGDWLRYWGLRIGSCSLAGIFGFLGLVITFEPSLRMIPEALVFGPALLIIFGMLLGLVMMVAGAMLDVLGK